MRKINIFIVFGIIITFSIHAISGSIALLGGTVNTQKMFAWICIGFITAHIILTTILAVKTLLICSKSGVGYFRNNISFWVKRISGLTVLIPLIMHLTIFKSENSDAYRVQVFNTGRFISQVLLIAAIALHVLINIKPLLISIGIHDIRLFSADFMFVISILLLIFAIAFAVYYSRWMSY